MIGQYLPNNNENATVPILQKILHLNRAFVVLCETNVLNLISQRLDTIYQIKPKHSTVHFSSFPGELNTPKRIRKSKLVEILAFFIDNPIIGENK
jgi:hypothetical protein